MVTLVQNSLFVLLFGSLLGGLIVFALLSLFWRDKYSKTRDELLQLADSQNFFSRKQSVMRRDERQLFDIFMKIFGNTYYIFPQVRLANVLDIKENLKDHDSLFREIDHRSLDFVFFDRVNIAPVLAIELNGGSHLMLSRKNRDQKIVDILTKAGIGYLAVEKNAEYNEDFLREQVKKNEIPTFQVK